MQRSNELQYLVNKSHCIDQQLCISNFQLSQDAHEVLAQFHSYAVHTNEPIQSSVHAEHKSFFHLYG